MIIPWIFSAALFMHSQAPAAADRKTTATPPQTQQSGRTPPKRVRADLSGFELDKSGTHPSTQIGGATRGSGPEPALLAPRLGKAYDIHPVFRWQQTNKANSFTFRLMSSDGTQVYTAAVSGRSFRYPPEAPALKTGERYSWTLEPELALLGAAAMPVDFTIVGNGEREQIDKELQNVGANPQSAAEIYTNHLLWYDSVEAYTSMIEAHPENADLYQRRAEIYQQVPATRSLASSDLEKAERLGKHE